MYRVMEKQILLNKSLTNQLLNLALHCGAELEQHHFQMKLSKKVLHPPTARAELVWSVYNVDIMFSAPAVLPYRSPAAASPYLQHTDAASDPHGNALH